MPTDPNAFAEMVALTVKAALTPILERVAGLEARLSVLGDLRDRVVVVETKAAAPLPVPEPYPDTLALVLERLAGIEARVDRVPVLEVSVGEMRDRVLTMETKAAAVPVDVHRDGPSVADLELKIHAAVEPVKTELVHLHERVAVVEVRAQIPGPPGADGKDGKDGKHGTDGHDGFTADELSAVQDGERAVVFKMTRGNRVKEIGRLVSPVMIQRGVYVDGKVYAFGDVVTWGGSQWHANEDTTTKPGEGSKAWTLIVKRGRDGKDGRDAVTVPVVSVGSR